MSDKAYIEQFYLVAATDDLLIAVEVEEEGEPAWAEVTIPYHDPDGKVYGITCRIYGIPNTHPAFLYLPALQVHARLLARRGQARVDQWENVAALYSHGAKPADEVTGMIEFSRPQDFATRGLYDPDVPAWKYRLINYITRREVQIRGMNEPITLPAGRSYICNAWVDVPMDDVDMMENFGSLFYLMSM